MAQSQAQNPPSPVSGQEGIQINTTRNADTAVRAANRDSATAGEAVRNNNQGEIEQEALSAPDSEAAASPTGQAVESPPDEAAAQGPPGETQDGPPSPNAEASPDAASATPNAPATPGDAGNQQGGEAGQPPSAPSGGINEYADWAGDLIGGVDRLGYLGTSYWFSESLLQEIFTTDSLRFAGVPPVISGSRGLIVDESGLASGTEPGSGSHMATDSIRIDFSQQLVSIQIGSLLIRVSYDAQGNMSYEVTGDNGFDHGFLEILGLEEAGSNSLILSYRYTLTGNQAHPDPDDANEGLPEALRIPVLVTDSDGRTGETVISLDIRDDAPLAYDDRVDLDEHSLSVTGSVINGQYVLSGGGEAASGSPDQFGADGNGGFQFGTEITFTRAGQTITLVRAADGSLTDAEGVNYGSLTLNPDGTYAYSRPDPAKGHLSEMGGELRVGYTIQDGDGDRASAELILEIARRKERPSITPETPELPFEPGEPGDPSGPGGVLIPKSESSELLVDESGLANGTTAGNGSAAAINAVMITSHERLASIELGGLTITFSYNPDGSFTYQVGGESDVPYGVLELIGIRSDDGIVYHVAYRYTLRENQAHPDPASHNEILPEDIPIRFVVTDQSGDTDEHTIPLQVRDDGPIALDDRLGLAENETMVTGNVLSGEHRVDRGDVISVGTDVYGADGRNQANGFSFDGEIVFSGSDGPVTLALAADGTLTDADGVRYGTLLLNPDGSYSYSRPEPGQGRISDLGGELRVGYVITDGDGDTDTAQLVITVDEKRHGPVITPETPHIPGDPEDPDAPDIPASDGSGLLVDESGLESGTEAASGSDRAVNAISIVANQKLATIEIGGLTITFTYDDGNNFTYTVSGTESVPFGVFELLNITSPDGVTYYLSYRYTLNESQTHPDPASPNEGLSSPVPIPVRVTDQNGDSAGHTIELDILDDAPVATDDRVTLQRDDDSVHGSVLSGEFQVDNGQPSTSGSPDKFGADGEGGFTFNGLVTFLHGGESVSLTLAADGSLTDADGVRYGTLILNADSTYSYTRPDPTLGQLSEMGGELRVGYTIRDGDGDTASANLVITVDERKTGPTITPETPEIPGDPEDPDDPRVPAAGGSGLLVDESGLADGTGAGNGSDRSVNAVAITSYERLATIEVGGLTVSLTYSADGSFTYTVSGSENVPYGTFELLDLRSADGVHYYLIYRYTLTDSQDHFDTSNHNEGLDAPVRIPLTVTDASGDSASHTINLDILDDGPIATDDRLTLAEEQDTVSGSVLGGSYSIDGGSAAQSGAADQYGADGASNVNGFAFGSSVSFVTGQGTITLNRAADGSLTDADGVRYGTLILNADSTYSYTRPDPTLGQLSEMGGELRVGYTIRDGDGDTASANLVITVDERKTGPTITPETPEIPGDPEDPDDPRVPAAGGSGLLVDESGLADGTGAGNGSDRSVNAVAITSYERLATIEVGGLTVSLTYSADGSFTYTVSGSENVPFGTFELLDLRSADGVNYYLIYRYTLTDRQDHSDTSNHNEGLDAPVQIPLTVTDASGDSANHTINLDILDDGPIATDDRLTLAEEQDTVSGSVLGGTYSIDGGAAAQSGMADQYGADGADDQYGTNGFAFGSSVSFVTGQGTITLNRAADGSLTDADGVRYGTLILNADGTYTYTRPDPSLGHLSEMGGELRVGYTIRDGDGDTASANLVITVDERKTGPTITPETPEIPGDPEDPDDPRVPAAGGSGLLVDESGLANGTGAGNGSDRSVNAVAITSYERLATIEAGGLTISLTYSADGSFTYTVSGSENVPFGTFELLDLRSADGVHYYLIYRYTLTDSQDHPDTSNHNEGLDAPVRIPLTVTDASGDSASHTINLEILDDGPIATDDRLILAEEQDTVSGSVLGGSYSIDGGSAAQSGAADQYGADGASNVNGFDFGSSVSFVTGQGTITLNRAADGSLTDASGVRYGTLILNADGTYTYTRPDPSLGHVSELGGELRVGYTIRDGDGDSASANLVITVDERKTRPTITPETPEIPGDPEDPDDPGVPAAGGSGLLVDESGLANGTEAGNGGDRSVNAVLITSYERLATIEAGGLTISLTYAADGSFTYTVSGSENVPFGTFELLDLRSADGVNYYLIYRYTLTDNQDHSNTSNHNEGLDAPVQIPLTVTDASGDSANHTISLEILDDGPIANDDRLTLAEEQDTVSGSVLGGSYSIDGGAAAQSGAADQYGADGASNVNGFAFESSVSFVTSQGTIILNRAADGSLTDNGGLSYGKLVLNADGTYSYTRPDPSLGHVSEMGGELRVGYTIRDGDGDSASANLVITVDERKTRPTITPETPEIPGDPEDPDDPGVPATGGSGLLVDESGLANGTEAGSGSDRSVNAVLITSYERLATIEAGGLTISLTYAADGSFTYTVSGTENVPFGTFELLDLRSSDGVHFYLIYRYTLTDNQDHSDTSNHNEGLDAPVQIPLTVTDASGDSASHTINLDILDDGPLATDDRLTLAEEQDTVSGSVLGGSYSIDGGNAAQSGAADQYGADGASNTNSFAFGGSVSFVTAQGAITLNRAADGSLTDASGVRYGTLALNADGTYTYTRPDPSLGHVSEMGGELRVAYTIRDGDGDTASANLVITVDERKTRPTITPETPEIPGDPEDPNDPGVPAAGGSGLLVDESGLADGTEAGSGSDRSVNAVLITSYERLATIVAGGLTISLTYAADGSFTYTVSGSENVPFGTFELLDLRSSDGINYYLIYRYTLTDNQNHSDTSNHNEGLDAPVQIPLTVTDASGDSASHTINLEILDDGPIATDDRLILAEEQDTVSGSVLGGSYSIDGGSTSQSGAADHYGADGANSTNGFAFGNSVSFVTAQGTITLNRAADGSLTDASGVRYGTLVLNADGTYTYTRPDPSLGHVSEMGGQLRVGYTIRDGDGDSASANMVITVDERKTRPTITPETPEIPGDPEDPDDPGVPAAGGSGLLVDESGLANGTEAGGGSDRSVNAVLITSYERLATIEAGGLTISLTYAADGSFTYSVSGTENVPFGTFELLDLRSSDGINYYLIYRYTLTDNQDHSNTSNHNEGLDAPVQIPLTVTDASGDSASHTISLDILDDGPIANDDRLTLAEEQDTVSGSVLGGSFSIDGGNAAQSGAADQYGADGANSANGFAFGNSVSFVTAQGTITLNRAADGSLTDASGVRYGTLVLNADGTYSYTRPNPSLGHVSEMGGELRMGYTIQDGDGDTASANLVITVDERKTRPTITPETPEIPGDPEDPDDPGVPAAAATGR